MAETDVADRLARIEAKLDLIVETIGWLQDKTWTVSISTADVEKGLLESREITRQIQAPTGKKALIKAISEFELLDGELFHDVHIGPPDKPHVP